jgi:hypothetical protein
MAGNDLSAIGRPLPVAWSKINSLESWKKQADGNWKCIVDTWNSDLPAAPSTPSSTRVEW